MRPSEPLVAPLAAIAHSGPQPVFAEPWQAHAFAIALQLHERGLFEWSEWTALLAAEIGSAQPASGEPDEDAGTRYYRHWLDALEKLIVAKRIGTRQQIHDLEHAWAAAAERTPHGQPIVLEKPE